MKTIAILFVLALVACGGTVDPGPGLEELPAPHGPYCMTLEPIGQTSAFLYEPGCEGNEGKECTTAYGPGVCTNEAH